jgi:hypothetical protein
MDNPTFDTPKFQELFLLFTRVFKSLFQITFGQYAMHTQYI